MSWVNYLDFLMLPSQHFKLEPGSTQSFVAFDLDGTLVCYKNGMAPYKLDTPADNYNFLGPVKEKIIELSKSYLIFIISNQSNIPESKARFIENIWRELDCIPYVFVANKDNQFRKPNPTFMEIIPRILYVTLNHATSYYCGDAIGEHDPYPPYRWGDADFMFTRNCGLNFVRPIDLFVPNNRVADTELVIMLGNMGSGKTTYATMLQTQHGYHRYSQDECKDLTKKQGEVIHLLQSGQKVVLDATFASTEKRYPWIYLACQLGKRVTIAWCIRDGRPFNKLRPLYGLKAVPEVAYNTHYTKIFNDPQNDQLAPYVTVIKIC